MPIDTDEPPTDSIRAFWIAHAAAQKAYPDLGSTTTCRGLSLRVEAGAPVEARDAVRYAGVTTAPS